MVRRRPRPLPAGGGRVRHQRQRCRRAAAAAASTPDRLPLGGVPSMVAEPVDRDLDVLFLGGDTDHRRAVLADSRTGAVGPAQRAAPVPVHRAGPRRCAGSRLRRRQVRLLARSRILVNIHRDGPGRATSNGHGSSRRWPTAPTVVTEPSTGYHATSSRRRTSSRPTTSPARVAELLDDVERCAAIGSGGRRRRARRASAQPAPGPRARSSRQPRPDAP